MRYVRKTLLALLILLLVFGVFVVANLDKAVDDGYAQRGAAEMVIDYMEAHDGNWPRDWEALRPNFEAGGGRVGGWSFEQFQKSVVIHFDADARVLRQKSIDSGTVPFNVIHARSAFALEIGDGPNTLLHRYFRKKAGIARAN